MNHLKIYEEELSPFTRELFLLNNYVDICFVDSEDIRIVNNKFLFFQRFLKSKKIPFLITNTANPYFVISTSYTPLQIWELVTIDEDSIANRDAGPRQTNNYIHFQIWDLYSDPSIEETHMYSIYIIDGRLVRSAKGISSFKY